MAKVSTGTTKRRRKPATTPEAQESRMISLAMGVAEQQLLDGTASSQVITHFLKLGSSREKLERERLEKENELLRAKTKEIADKGEYKELVNAAIKAMGVYKGEGDPDDY